MIMCFRPSSIRLAISISPSRVRSSTDPISRMYMRTGSVVRPNSESSVDAAASASSSTSSAGTVAGVSAISSVSASGATSYTWMPMSPIIEITPSICSASRMSSGRWSLISAYVRKPRSLPSTISVFRRRLRASTSAGVSSRGARSACLPFLPFLVASSARLPASLAAISLAVGLCAAAATGAPGFAAGTPLARGNGLAPDLSAGICLPLATLVGATGFPCFASALSAGLAPAFVFGTGFFATSLALAPAFFTALCVVFLAAVFLAAGRDGFLAAGLTRRRPCGRPVYGRAWPLPSASRASTAATWPWASAWTCGRVSRASWPWSSLCETVRRPDAGYWAVESTHAGRASGMEAP